MPCHLLARLAAWHGAHLLAGIMLKRSRYPEMALICLQAKRHASQARALTAGLPEALRGQAAVMAVTSGARTPEGVQVAHGYTDRPTHATGQLHLLKAQRQHGDVKESSGSP